MPFTVNEEIRLDAGVFIGALLKGDSRHEGAREIVEAARAGLLSAATTTSILCEVYAALTWHMATPPHSPSTASLAVLALIVTPSVIRLIPDRLDAATLTVAVAGRYNLTARRVHDARHAATALVGGGLYASTYNVGDWTVFAPEGISVVSPAELLNALKR